MKKSKKEWNDREKRSVVEIICIQKNNLVIVVGYFLDLAKELCLSLKLMRKKSCDAYLGSQYFSRSLTKGVDVKKRSRSKKNKIFNEHPVPFGEGGSKNFLFLLHFDPEASKTCKNTIKLLELRVLPYLGVFKDRLSS